MAILLAVGAAVGWGAADFFGGAFRRRTPVLVIVAVSEVIGLVVVVPVLIARGVPLPHNPRVLLACVAGVGVTVELALIYVALSRGEGFVTAPVGAFGAAIAVTVGLIGGDPFSPMIAAGLLCALIGGGISAWASGRRSGARSGLRGAAICAGAAAGVATMLISFHAAGQVDPYWATALEHASTAISAAVIALTLSGKSLREHLPDGRQLQGLALVAVVGVGGDLAYAAASQNGALSVVSAVSSLYPLTTVALGVMIQRQRAGRIQTAGILLALIGATVLGTTAH
jgi:drug/metabolite transporter (DMT)-like permease